MAIPQAARRGPRELLAHSGGRNAEGGGEVDELSGATAGPEAGGEAGEVDLERLSGLGWAEQDMGGGVEAKAVAEAFEGAHRGKAAPALDLIDDGVRDAGARGGLADGEPEQFTAAAEFAGNPAVGGGRGTTPAPRRGGGAPARRRRIVGRGTERFWG